MTGTCMNSATAPARTGAAEVTAGGSDRRWWTLVAMTGTNSPLVYKELPQDDPRQRQPDIGLAREKLGWAPTEALEAGLEKTIAYFDALLAAQT